MELPELPIPELPDEAAPSTSGVSQNREIPQPKTAEYVTSLGMIVSLLEKDLQIAPELLQRDPDITELDKPEQMENVSRIITLPCSINLRHLEECDIAKWQMQKIPVTLLDRTENVPSTKDVTDPKYKLCKRERTASRPTGTNHKEKLPSLSPMQNLLIKVVRTHKSLAPSILWITDRSQIPNWKKLLA